jgi:hypothetical protein
VFLVWTARIKTCEQRCRTIFITEINNTSCLLFTGAEIEVVTSRVVTASRTYWLAGLRDGEDVLRCLNVTCESEIEAFEELDLLLERDLGTEAVAKFMRGLTRL